MEKLEETKRKTPLEMFKEIKELEVADSPLMTVEDCLPFMCEKVEQALTELKAIKEANPSEAMKILLKAKQERLNFYGRLLDNDEKFFEILELALLKAQEQIMKYNEINKTFNDSHICEIKKEFAKYTSLCVESKCEECALGVGDGICLKNVFEKKWESQIKAQELEKENAELRQHIKRWHDLLLKTGINSKGTVVDEIENYWAIKTEK